MKQGKSCINMSKIQTDTSSSQQALSKEMAIQPVLKSIFRKQQARARKRPDNGQSDYSYNGS